MPIRHSSHVFLILTALVLLGHTAAFAVEEAGAPLLDYPVHARTVGMGRTGVADNSDPSTIYFNPANAVAEPRIYLTGSRMDWPDNWFWDDLWIGRANAGFVWQGEGAGPLTWGTDVTFSKFDYGEAITTLPDGTPLGTVHPFEKVLSLALAVGIPSGERYEFRVGLAAKRFWADYGLEADGSNEVEFDAYAFDAGVTAVAHATVDGWNVRPALGAALVDAGPDFEVLDGHSDPLPMRFNFGASIHIESPAQRLGNADVPLVAVTANLDATEPRFGDFTWGLGTEIAIAQILFLRTGSHTDHREGDEVDMSAWGVGLGFPLSSLRVRFDYTKSDYYLATRNEHMGVALTWVF